MTECTINQHHPWECHDAGISYGSGASRRLIARRGVARVPRFTVLTALFMILTNIGQVTLFSLPTHEAITSEDTGHGVALIESSARPHAINPFRNQCAFEKTAVYDSELIRSLRVGDVILVRAAGSNFMNSLISEFTRSPYSHAAIYVGDGWCISAGAQGITYDGELLHKFVDVMRVKGGLTDSQQDEIVAAAQESLGRGYGYATLFGFPFLTHRSAKSGGSAYVCSEHTAWSLAAGGIDVTPDSMMSPIPAPADIAHADNLVWLGSWNHDEPVVDAELNVRHPLQGESAKLASLVIHIVADPFSKEDEYYAALSDSEDLLKVVSAR